MNICLLDFAGHVDLRNFSPLTYIVSINRRRGRQRGPGGLISALVTLNKFRVSQLYIFNFITETFHLLLIKK